MVCGLSQCEFMRPYSFLLFLEARRSSSSSSMARAAAAGRGWLFGFCRCHNEMSVAPESSPRMTEEDLQLPRSKTFARVVSFALEFKEQLLEQVIECLREANTRQPDSHAVPITLSYCLSLRFNTSPVMITATQWLLWIQSPPAIPSSLWMIWA